MLILSSPRYTSRILCLLLLRTAIKSLVVSFPESVILPQMTFGSPTCVRNTFLCQECDSSYHQCSRGIRPCLESIVFISGRCMRGDDNDNTFRHYLPRKILGYEHLFFPSRTPVDPIPCYFCGFPFPILPLRLGLSRFMCQNSRLGEFLMCFRSLRLFRVLQHLFQVCSLHKWRFLLLLVRCDDLSFSLSMPQIHGDRHLHKDIRLPLVDVNPNVLIGHVVWSLVLANINFLQRARFLV